VLSPIKPRDKGRGGCPKADADPVMRRLVFDALHETSGETPFLLNDGPLAETISGINLQTTPGRFEH
jgi:hypothetical protein